MAYPDEKVLVVPTAVFHELGVFQGFSGDVEKYLPRLLDGRVMEFRLRAEVEKQPEWKQLIPYILFRWQDADGRTHIFRYTRGKGMGEGRLHLKHSVGVGGHISLEDAGGAAAQNGLVTDAAAVYRAGMKREWEEEVEIQTEILAEKIIGLINDDATEVGSVHLGVVHVVDVAEPKVMSREDDIIDSGFILFENITDNMDNFESWSQIALKSME